jgi:hypothetical protein
MKSGGLQALYSIPVAAVKAVKVGKVAAAAATFVEYGISIGCGGCNGLARKHVKHREALIRIKAGCLDGGDVVRFALW